MKILNHKNVIKEISLNKFDNCCNKYLDLTNLISDTNLFSNLFISK